MENTTTQQLLKSLEERAKEIEALRRDLRKCEAERKALESQRLTFDGRQPPDVQALLAQKRELNAQLEREESEKHELFTQINKLIGEIAELRSIADGGGASANTLAALIAEHDELKRDFGRKEAAFQASRDELASARAEAERRERTLQLEKSRLAAEAQDAQRELELKSAALQSLRLATQDFNGSSFSALPDENVSRLREELHGLRTEVAEKEDLLRELTESNDELGRALSAASADTDALRANAAALGDELRAAVDEKARLATRLDELRAELSQTAAEALESARIEMREKEREESAGELTAARGELTALQQRVGELEAALAIQSNSAVQEMTTDDRDEAIKALTVEREKLRANLSAADARLACVDKRVRELEEALELAGRRADAAYAALAAELSAQKSAAAANLSMLRDAEARSQRVDKFVANIVKALELPKADKFSSDKLLSDDDKQLSLDKIAIAAHEELAALRSDVAELAELRRELDASRADAKTARQALAEIIRDNDVEKIKKSLTNETNELRSLLAAQGDAATARAVECAQLRAEHADTQAEMRALRAQVATLDVLIAERANLEARVRELSAGLAAKDAEIDRIKAATYNNEKVQELIDENARLAGDLLKRESDARREYMIEFARERDGWLAERQELEKELAQLRAEAPAPKPRKSAVFPSKNGNSNADENVNAVEIQRLRADLEKQKRLVTVLRKKLQPELLAKGHGAENGVKTLPRRLQ